MGRPSIRFRATRAAPPGLAAADEKRRALFSAALQQSEDLFEAAHAVGPLARPIPLFYAISQAGRAVAASWLKDQWQVSGHGLTQDRRNEAWRTSSMLRFGIKPQQNGGVFGGVAHAQGVPGLTGGVELGALWSALPGQEPPACAISWALAMPVWPHVYMEGQANLARLGAAHRGYVFLRDQVATGDPKVVMEHLKKYPAAEDARLEMPQGIIQQGPTPWGYGPSVRWPQPPASLSPEGIPSAEMLESHVTCRVPRYRYGREHWLVPVVGDGNDDVPPLLIWWSLIFGLSLLARYEPVAWQAVLNPDQSELAVPLERLLDDALDIAPELLYEAITQQPALLPPRI